MKKSSLKLFCAFLIGFFTLWGIGIIEAADFCVSTPTELGNALTTAESNGEADTIRIVQGTYTGNFTYSSQQNYDLTIEGGYTIGCVSRDVDPANTIFDAAQIGRALTLETTEAFNTASFIIDGLTFQNGKITDGNSQSSGSGAGLYIDTDGRITLTNNSFKNNIADSLSYGVGGGLFVETTPGPITLTNNSFSNNYAGYWAGGARLNGKSILTNNSFNNNSSVVGAGGIQISHSGSSSNLTNNSFSNNSVSFGSGGGIIIFGSNTVLTNNSFNNNYAWRKGGGAFIDVLGGTAKLMNNIFNNNSSEEPGGGVGIYGRESAQITLTNNTITENASTTPFGGGGGLWLRLGDDSASANIYNNIIWGNSSDTGGADIYIENDQNGNSIPSTVNLYNNDFNHTVPTGLYIQIPFFIDPSNLDDIDPLFVDAANGDYHLSFGSPVIDFGNNSAPSLPETDFEGDTRVSDGNGDTIAITDIGADEYIWALYYSDITVTPASHDFGSVKVGDISAAQTFTVSNTGTADLVISSIGLTGGDAVMFSVVTGTCPSLTPTIVPGDNCTITATFTPTSGGSKSTTLRISSNDPDENPFDIPLSGTGNALPTADPNGPYTGIEGQAITLDGSGSTDSDGTIELYEWDVDNDGIYEYSTSSPTQSHTYDQQGTYTIKLIVTDNLGATDEATTTATISDTSPLSAFTGDPTDGEAPLTVNFTNNSTGYDQPLSYAWDFDNNGAIDSTVQNPTYTYDTAGTYTVSLTVTDADGSTDTLTKENYIIVNEPPVADAGSDQNVVTGEIVTLDGSNSYDPEGSTITFLWAFTNVPSGSSTINASLSDATSAKPAFTPDIDGTYELELTVSDGELQDSDTVSIFAATDNVAPNADAGPDQNVLTGSLVYLDGSASDDPDNGSQPLSYLWSFNLLPQGSVLTDNDITDKEQANASFTPDVDGTHEVKLLVSDGELTSEDTVQIMATTTDVLPNANAGDDITVYLGDTAVLDGSASNDPDNQPEPLTYSWSFVAVPAESNITNSDLSGADTVSPSFIPDVAGMYVLELMVSDGQDSDFDNAAVSVVQNISIFLTSGWNLISLPLLPDDTSITSVLSSISGLYTVVWSYENGTWKVYDPANPGFSDLTTMEAGKGYWIYMTEAATFTVADSTPSTSIPLITGWNLVGYNSLDSQDISSALDSIAGKYLSAWAYINGVWKVYDPANPGFSDLTTMEPAYGYWINATEASTWTLP